MLIINADDCGRTREATDRIVHCHREGRVTATSFMVYMEDSERACALVKEASIDVGLHINFDEPFTGTVTQELRERQGRLCRFLRFRRYASLFYHPGLRRDFDYVFHAQVQEFVRLFESAPVRYDGHHHMHLCTNMLLQRLIPRGAIVRRSFSPIMSRRSYLKDAYRCLVNLRLKRWYRLADFLYALPECLKHRLIEQVARLAIASNVELETHPEAQADFQWLLSGLFTKAFSGLKLTPYAAGVGVR